MTDVTLLRKSAVALTLATLMLSRQLACWTAPENRFYYHWERSDGVAHVLLLLLLAAILLTAEWIGRRAFGGRLRKPANGLFAVGVVFAMGDLYLTPWLLRAMAPPPGYGWLMIWAPVTAVYLVTGIAAALSGDRLVKAMGAGCLVFSPVAPIIIAGLLGFKPCGPSFSNGPRSGKVEAGRGSGVSQRVVVVICDEWSLDRSAGPGFAKVAPKSGVNADEGDNAVFISVLTNLNRLSRKSIVFTAAKSAGGETQESLPGLVYAENGRLEIASRGVYWTLGEERRKAPDADNLFSYAKSRGWRTSLLGYYFPYGCVVGEALDDWRSPPHMYKPAGLLGKIVNTAERAALDYHHPFLFRLFAPLRRAADERFFRHWHELSTGLARDAVDRTARLKPGEFLFIHLTIPHPPPVFTAEGGYRRPDKGVSWQGTPDDYLRTMAYMDLELGRIFAKIERCGSDQVMLVVTSDHSWREDPARDQAHYPSWVRKVPLLIHCAGQKDQVLVTREFGAGELRGVIQGALDGRVTKEQVLRGIQSHVPDA